MDLHFAHTCVQLVHLRVHVAHLSVQLSLLLLQHTHTLPLPVKPPKHALNSSIRLCPGCHERDGNILLGIVHFGPTSA